MNYNQSMDREEVLATRMIFTQRTVFSTSKADNLERRASSLPRGMKNYRLCHFWFSASSQIFTILKFQLLCDKSTLDKGRHQIGWVHCPNLVWQGRQTTCEAVGEKVRGFRFSWDHQWENHSCCVRWCAEDNKSCEGSCTRMLDSVKRVGSGVSGEWNVAKREEVWVERIFFIVENSERGEKSVWRILQIKTFCW